MVDAAWGPAPDRPAPGEGWRAGVFEAEDGPDDEFIFGLDRILDGVEVLVKGRD